MCKFRIEGNQRHGLAKMALEVFGDAKILSERISSTMADLGKQIITYDPWFPMLCLSNRTVSKNH